MKHNSMDSEIILLLNLQLMADGGDGAVGDTGVTGADDASQSGVAEESAEQDDAAQVKEADEDSEFADMIKGKYAKPYNKAVKRIVDARVKDRDALAAAVSQHTPILEKLAAKYGLKADDYDGLVMALEVDSPEFEAEAMKRGLTKDQYKDILLLEQENKSMKARIEKADRTERANQIYSGWMEESRKLREIYPDFDLEHELNANEQFGKLLEAGIDIKNAFEVIHKDEIMPAAMKYAAKTVSDKLSKSVAANQSRPSENGTGSPAIVQKSVADLSSAEVKDYMKRVERGERVSFSRHK